MPHHSFASTSVQPSSKGPSGGLGEEQAQGRSTDANVVGIECRRRVRAKKICGRRDLFRSVLKTGVGRSFQGEKWDICGLQ